MRKLLCIAGLTVVATVVATTFAAAQNAHLLSSPVCTLSGTTVVCTGGKAAGLGNAPVTVSADIAAGCETRSGSNQPSGHAQAQSAPIQPRGGRINFPTLTLSADCPPGLNPVFGSTVTYTILDAEGNVVLTFTVPVTT